MVTRSFSQEAAYHRRRPRASTVSYPLFSLSLSPPAGTDERFASAVRDFPSWRWERRLRRHWRGTGSWLARGGLLVSLGALVVCGAQGRPTHTYSLSLSFNLPTQPCTYCRVPTTPWYLSRYQTMRCSQTRDGRLLYRFNFICLSACLMFNTAPSHCVAAIGRTSFERGSPAESGVAD